jgi:hypothetical protein
MTDRKETTLFAFKIAEKQSQEAKSLTQFKVRDGVAIAGCSGPLPNDYDNYREYTGTWQGDKGVYC